MKLKKLIELIKYQNKDYYNAKIEESNGRFIATLPKEYFTIESRDITDELASNEIKKNIYDISLGTDSIEISAYIYKSRINIENFSDQKISLYLKMKKTNHLTPLDITPLNNKRAD